MEDRYTKEYEVIQKTGNRPILYSDLNSAFAELGINSRSTLMLHSSLSAVGWLLGGPLTLIRCIMDRIGWEGLLVIPSHSNDLSDPAEWENPPVPESWKPLIRQEMPPFDQQWTPASRLGRVAEYFRNLPQVKRSHHPLFSLSAWGRGASELTLHHPLDFPHGNASPLARLYDMNAKILLYGVGFTNCTAIHLAEYRANWTGKKDEVLSAPMSRNDGTTVWQKFKEVESDTADFQTIGDQFAQSNPELIQSYHLGYGTIMAIEMRPLIDFAVAWMESNRREDRESG